MIGYRVKQLRLEKGLTQAELADLLGMTPGALSMVELNKRSVSLEIIEKLVAVFKVSADYIIGTNVQEKSSRFSAIVLRTFTEMGWIKDPENITDEEIERLTDKLRNLL